MKNPMTRLTEGLKSRLSLGSLTRGSLIMGVGSRLTDAFFNKRRAALENTEPLIDNLSAYDLGKGAGRLIGRWLEYRQPAAKFEAHRDHLLQLLSVLDELDPDFQGRARNRFLVSKALFYLEHFKLGQHAYEKVQAEATRLLRLLPEHEGVTKKEVFLGEPFAVSELIGHTHALLIAMTTQKEHAQLEKFLHQDADNNPLHEAADYYAQLIALTFPYEGDEAGQSADPAAKSTHNPAGKNARGESADRFTSIMMDWFESFKQFQLAQTHQQEKFAKGALAVASGQGPSFAGWEAIKKLRGGK